jgi:diadenylate cyclase
LDFLNNISFNDLVNNFAGYLGFNKNPLAIIQSIVDIGIVSYVIYKVVVLVKETRAWQLIKGILFILIASELSKVLGLKTIAFILSNTISIAAISIVILFQPELRRGLEQIGRSRFRDLFNFDEQSAQVQTSTVIDEIVKACVQLSKTYTGALIVVEKETKVGEIINTGIQLDSNVSAELLVNIFTPNTPLHDGAVILRDNKIKAAACFLPLTDNLDLSKELGTRHRAALGITEISDSIAIVVSEESGKISFALNGGLTRNLNADTLRKALTKNMLEKYSPAKRLTLWKVRAK